VGSGREDYFFFFKNKGETERCEGARFNFRRGEKNIDANSLLLKEEKRTPSTSEGLSIFKGIPLKEKREARSWKCNTMAGPKEQRLLRSANESGGVSAILCNFYSDAACPYNQFIHSSWADRFLLLA